jgi:hypothetical protein
VVASKSIPHYIPRQAGVRRWRNLFISPQRGAPFIFKLNTYNYTMEEWEEEEEGTYQGKQ